MQLAMLKQLLNRGMLECGFCGAHLTRRSWHSGSKYHKVIWHCVTSTKKGKKYCEHSKGISEEIIEQAFLESYRLLCYNNKDIIDELLNRIETSLCPGEYAKEISKTEKAISALEKKKSKLLDMKLDDLVDMPIYEEKNAELTAQIDSLNDDLAVYSNTKNREMNINKRLADFRRVLENNDVLVEFDRGVFESIVDKVIVGGYDDDGNPDPSMLTFIYKTGFTNNIDAAKHKPARRNKDKQLCSSTNDGDENVCSYNSDNTRRDNNVAATPRYVEILDFKHFVKHTVFNTDGDKYRNKELKKYIIVKVAIDMVCGNTRN